MNRKPTKTTRGPNAEEKRYQAWVKWQPCCGCGMVGPSIVHHCEGATFKHNKILLGHWFVISLCQVCDNVITRGSRRAFRDQFGPQSKLWAKQHRKSATQAPDEVVETIKDWGR